VKACPTCSAQVRDDATACPGCGGRWSEDGSFQPAPEVTTVPHVATGAVEHEPCPVCGEPLLVDARAERSSCSRCGSHLLRNKQTGVWVVVGSRGKTPPLAVAGFACALVSFLGMFVPIVGIVLAVFGVVLSAIGRSQGKARGGATGLATAGLVLSVVGTVLWVVMAFVLVWSSGTA
jgi:hypothetical protein